MSFGLSKVLNIINKTVDVALVWMIIYYALKSFKKNVKLSLLIKGVLIVIFLKVIADFFNFVTVGLILEYIIMWGPLAIIIIFQPEIRKILEDLGRQKLISRNKILTVDEREKVIYEITTALEEMRKEKVGAIIAVERSVSLSDYISKAKPVYAEVSSDLLRTIFFPNSPLHDGAVIIEADEISCAGAVFPTSSNLKPSFKGLGTRHRAALGLSEETDALLLVVSEETGKISMAIKGELYYNVSLDEVRMTLIDELKPGSDSYKDPKLIEEEKIYEENK